jgi:hypothetical protein
VPKPPSNQTGIPWFRKSTICRVDSLGFQKRGPRMKPGFTAVTGSFSAAPTAKASRSAAILPRK